MWGQWGPGHRSGQARCQLVALVSIPETPASMCSQPNCVPAGRETVKSQPNAFLLLSAEAGSQSPHCVCTQPSVIFAHSPGELLGSAFEGSHQVADVCWSVASIACAPAFPFLVSTQKHLVFWRNHLLLFHQHIPST